MPEPQLIKEVFNGKPLKTIIIRSELYWDSLELFLIYFEEAKNDFPDVNLVASDVLAVIYGDDCCKRTRGIEFEIDKDYLVPDVYRKVSTTKSTL